MLRVFKKERDIHTHLQRTTAGVVVGSVRVCAVLWLLRLRLCLVLRLRLSAIVWRNKGWDLKGRGRYGFETRLSARVVGAAAGNVQMTPGDACDSSMPEVEIFRSNLRCAFSSCGGTMRREAAVGKVWWASLNVAPVLNEVQASTTPATAPPPAHATTAHPPGPGPGASCWQRRALRAPPRPWPWPPPAP